MIPKSMENSLSAIRNVNHQLDFGVISLHEGEFHESLNVSGLIFMIFDKLTNSVFTAHFIRVSPCHSHSLSLKWSDFSSMDVQDGNK